MRGRLGELCHLVYHQSRVFIDRSSSSEGSWGLDYVRSPPSRPNKVKRFQYKSKEVSFANCAFEKICCCWNPLVNRRYFIQSQLSHIWLQWLVRAANTVRVPGLRGSSSAWFLLITFIQSFEVKQWLHQGRVGVWGLLIRYFWVAGRPLQLYSSLNYYRLQTIYVIIEI